MPGLRLYWLSASEGLGTGNLHRVLLCQDEVGAAAQSGDEAPTARRAHNDVHHPGVQRCLIGNIMNSSIPAKERGAPIRRPSF